MRCVDRAARMDGMLNPLLAVHIAAGSIALSSMLVPLVAHTGGKTHRRAGWVFVGAMTVVSVTALGLSALRLLFDPTPEGRDAGGVLLLVTVLTGSGLSAGMRVLRFKTRAAAHAH